MNRLHRATGDRSDVGVFTAPFGFIATRFLEMVSAVGVVPSGVQRERIADDDRQLWIFYVNRVKRRFGQNAPHGHRDFGSKASTERRVGINGADVSGAGGKAGDDA